MTTPNDWEKVVSHEINSTYAETGIKPHQGYVSDDIYFMMSDWFSSLMQVSPGAPVWSVFEFYGVPFKRIHELPPQTTYIVAARFPKDEPTKLSGPA